MKTVGEKIAYLRKERKLSQEALGLEIGVSRSAIVKWEKGLMKEILHAVCRKSKKKSNESGRRIKARRTQATGAAKQNNNLEETKFE